MIVWQEETRAFRLDTPDATYAFHLHEGNRLVHDYFGRTVGNDDLRFGSSRGPANGCYPCPPGMSSYYSNDLWPLEYGQNGTGDFRVPALQITDSNGCDATDLRYQSHKIYEGKPAIPGQPATYADETEADTLELLCFDPATGIEITLYYTVFRNLNVITRRSRISNPTENEVEIDRVASMCLDINDADYELLHSWGTWAKERSVSREKLGHGIKNISVKRGLSSHQHHPFFALLRPGTDEETGDVIAVNLVYSGNFAAEIEVDAFSRTRAVMGINPETFRWKLEPGAVFDTPEAVIVFSDAGLGKMSRTFHRLYRYNLCRGPWKTKERPILINNWEATRFNFDGNKIYDIAKRASELGVEMMVMDDGWFGARDNDRMGLGDWFVNEEKLNGPLSDLVDRIHSLGMKFGIWFEPEMVNPISNLYEAHPDWCLQVPGREMSLSRNQYVLDMSRSDVRDYLFDCMTKVMDSCKIDYVKWDCNRPFTEVGSLLLGKDRQKETFHRYVLGLYDLLERLLNRYPDLLLEGCASGGGRYDPAMLYYSPQYWASDETDAIERLSIQYGSSLTYPACTMGAHVSACPCAHVKRTTPFQTRADVAMAGTFGYELDITKLTEEEAEMVKQQCKDYHKYFNVIHNGELYRLQAPTVGGDCSWMFVTPDKREALITLVVSETKHQFYRTVFPRGLDPEKNYREEETGIVRNGKTWMQLGIYIPHNLKDYQSLTWHLIAE